MLSPYLNEELILPDFLAGIDAVLRACPGAIRWVLVDSGSTDSSRSIVEAFAAGREGLEAFDASPAIRAGGGPSPGRALDAYLKHFVGGTKCWVQVVPVDSRVDADGYRLLLKRIEESREHSWFAFSKDYFPTTFSLRLMGALQNALRLGFLGRAFWTNAIGVRAELLSSCPIPTRGFMEDTLWSDRLRKRCGRPLVAGRLGVSSRRYLPGRPLRRMGLNLLVLGLYRILEALPWVGEEKSLRFLQRTYLALR